MCVAESINKSQIKIKTQLEQILGFIAAVDVDLGFAAVIESANTRRKKNRTSKQHKFSTESQNI